MNLNGSSASLSVLIDIGLNWRSVMKITIESLNNGFLVTNEVDGEVSERIAFAFNEFEKECAVELLCCIKEMLGFYGSKHDAERIYIKLEKQHDC